MVWYVTSATGASEIFQQDNQWARGYDEGSDEPNHDEELAVGVQDRAKPKDEGSQAEKVQKHE
ncbi:hypothetical protein JG687_00007439 [Phytophthora cactorum]|uniref:Uncharacterized protein n=1 Tax=Phytophthora cactorum TaxID=29920 RepID=A0A329S0D4_9STRA|nr:hypothetical protein Pcac1_g6427 [Phytophthora cactorum]KAG2807058.1 hypothetical protein PC112_g17583 [Phytophthora cactorum]KAG2808709.1 hypothetical protein PC111_g16378 [Phytophthora cactorum]KAG2846172.1 hypothetical protein PC113_g18029 [Phytophthora cactorum]KAG2886288.1 hypothetical protein PC114_g19337 [Phytophthora cactorum]